MVAERQTDWDIEAKDLKALQDSGTSFRLIDVRESHEAEICTLGGELVPLKTLGGRISEFSPSEHLVVHCKAGPRSSQAVIALRAAGFENVWNLRGGILAWIDAIDPSLTRY